LGEDEMQNEEMRKTYIDLIGEHDMKRPLETSNLRSGDTRNVQLKKQKKTLRSVMPETKKFQWWSVLNKVKEVQVENFTLHRNSRNIFYSN
jgi:hypothetical protein